ncbi:DUF2000 family protein [Halomonas halmophila]|uniref:DUF2000 domain-containing protein n=1 Tax=Halomonas halmophila TaxID=252 RepID=A0A4Y4EWL8_9GAMM|nr:DUF2000 family protein [Halomonas halmophila]GED21523.1 hypothetical protein HHA01_05000 [Halomonas halmophila]
MQDTRIVVMVREDLAVWQKLNVTAFLMSGLAAEHQEIIGEPYADAEGNRHHRLAGEPVMVLSGSAAVLRNARRRANSRGVESAVYIDEMFATGNDAANRSVFAEHGPDEENVAGIAFRTEKKIADKISKGARRHA